MNKGQTLFEVILALSIIITIIVGIVSLAGISIANSTFSNEKTQATRYAGEGIEWLRGQRDKSFDDFLTNAQNSSTYCFLGSITWGEVGSCGANDYITGTNLKREANFLVQGENVEVTVKVYWLGRGKTNEVRTTTVFTRWK